MAPSHTGVERTVSLAVGGDDQVRDRDSCRSADRAPASVSSLACSASARMVEWPIASEAIHVGSVRRAEPRFRWCVHGSLGRVDITRPRLADVRQALEIFGKEIHYGVETVELVPAPLERMHLPLGRLVAPGRILLYDQARSPWRLEFHVVCAVRGARGQGSTSNARKRSPPG
jgi:hypothetical protein